MTKGTKLFVASIIAINFVVPVLFVRSAQASSWQSPSVHDDWSNASNWLGGIPNGSGAVAEFPDYANPPYEANVFVDGNYSVASLIFTNTSSPSDYYLQCSAPDSLSIYSSIASTAPAGSYIYCPLVLEGNIAVSGSYGVFVNSPISGSGGLTINADPGFRWYTTEPATYTGPTYINSGTLQGGYNDTLSPYSDFILADNADAMLQLGGPIPATIGSLSGGANSIVDLWGGTLTVGNDNDTTFAGTITNGIGGASSIVKQGSGTLTLTGNNTYTGATTVSEGMLVVDGSLMSSSVTVGSDATLRGSGTLPAVTLYGIVAPGNSIGTLTGTAFTFANGSTLENEISASGPTDLVEATSSVTIDSGATLKIIPDSGSYTAGQTFTIIRAPNVSGTFSSVVDTSGTLNYEVKYYSDRVDVVILQSSTVTPSDDQTLADTGANIYAISTIAGVLLVGGTTLLVRHRLHSKA